MPESCIFAPRLYQDFQRLPRLHRESGHARRKWDYVPPRITALFMQMSGKTVIVEGGWKCCTAKGSLNRKRLGWKVFHTLNGDIKRFADPSIPNPPFEMIKCTGDHWVARRIWTYFPAHWLKGKILELGGPLVVKSIEKVRRSRESGHDIDSSFVGSDWSPPDGRMATTYLSNPWMLFANSRNHTSRESRNPRHWENKW